GLELSFAEIASLRQAIFAGLLQVVITIGVVACVMLLWFNAAKSFFFGFVVALSSTAIVLKMLQEFALSDSPSGRISLAIALVQDIATVVLMLLIPLLANKSDNSVSYTLLLLLAKSVAVIIVVFIAAKYIIPKFLYEITRTRNRELFMISVVALCLGVTLATYAIGLSIELGAFLAGIIISESEYSGQTISSFIPFRDLFSSFFFISIGMLLNPFLILPNAVYITGLSLGIIIIKLLIVIVAILMIGYPLKTAALAGLSLAQIGEFSFILVQIGMMYSLLTQGEYQMVLSVSMATMVLSPFLMKYSQVFADVITKLPVPKMVLYGFAHSESSQVHPLKDHIIIVGYGINGRNVAIAAKNIKIPYIIVEMNPETVKKEKKEGENIIYGDASQEDLLYQVNIVSARVLVIAIADRSAIKRIIALARRINPHIHIIVRTRFVGDMKELMELGANEVIPEEYETSIEIFARVLQYYRVPRSDIEAMIESIRAKGYAMLRKLHVDIYRDLPIAEIDMQAIRVCPGSPVVGKTIGQMQLRKVHKFSVVAIKRGDSVITNPGADDSIESDDVLYVVGSRGALIKAVRELKLSDNATSCQLE
ncbi:MAG: cation:proton antiporter, partial [Spirochaetes bacterium]|nr:cation:proton antiporter [Spirochaetota bacterium]